MANQKKPRTVARVILDHQMRMAVRKANARRAAREKSLPVRTSWLYDPGVLKGELR